MLDQIAAEKKRLLAARKIKKEKPLPPITDDEKPFEIPDTWAWCRLGEVACIKGGFAFKSTEYCKEGIQIVRISDLGEDCIEVKDAAYYKEDVALEKYRIGKDSILICLTGSIGKMAWVHDEIPRYLNQRVGMLLVDKKKYLFLKERLAGNELKKEGLQPLHVLLDPDQGPLFPILKKIFCAFPSLPDGEYVEGLYEQLFAVGLFSEFYLSLSTTDEGVRLLPAYKSFWTGTFTDLFCSQVTKKKQRVTEAQTKAAYRELAECCRKLACEAEIQNSHVFRRMFREGRLPPGNVRPERKQKDSLPEEVAARVLKELRQNTIPVAVDGYTPRGCQAAVQIVNTKRPERDYFSDPNLSVLFERHVNTIANWRKGKGVPEGFSAAFEQKNYKAMKVCAEKYRASHGKHDAMNSKKVRRNLSAEQVYKESKRA